MIFIYVDIILTIELIPTTCFFSNIRTCVKPSEWAKIRKICCLRSNHRCEICGNNGKRQGFRYRVECHEIWEYDDINNTQKLKGVIALCPVCHMVKHFGRSTAIGKQSICMRHLESLNNWNHKEAVTYLKKIYEIQRERSRHQWKLDLSILNEAPYNLKLDLNKERIFKVKKYRRKRRKK